MPQTSNAKNMTNLLANQWNDEKAAQMSAAELLLYRSNLLGADKRITNYGGGNTSAKIFATDPLSDQEVEVLWVKGSGGDLGSMAMDGFATLYMDKLRAIQKYYRGPEFEDEMVSYLPHCTFNLNPRAASIDTPLHAHVPKSHVDHMHPDAIIAIAAAADSQRLTKDIFGDRIGWLPWKRPGYTLGLWLEAFCRDNPDAQGVVLESHGLFTWGDDARSCYENTLATINEAIVWFEKTTEGKAVFGGQKIPALPAEHRRELVANIMPTMRGLVSEDQSMIGHFDMSDPVMEFVCAKDMPALAALGTSCPDHFLRTKIRPLVVDYDLQQANKDQYHATFAQKLAEDLAAYRQEYAAYYERCKQADSPPLRNPNPTVFLIPAIGMVTFAKDKATARLASEFYINAINVMRGASSVSTYRGLPEQEAFNIEYWLLEEAKLQRMPKPKSLAGKIALITGGSGGIGSAIATRFLRDDACVLLADIDAESLEKTAESLATQFSRDLIHTVTMDVTNEQAVAASFAEIARTFGGIDILVSNAGIASSASIEETTLALWNQNMAILSTGYFLVSRAGLRMMKAQNIAGSIVFIGSKNGLAASPGASAYCTAKASELHLARCLALEGAPSGVRVNVVNPDAVLRGSKIWSSDWRKARAEAYNTSASELEEHYRQRALLKRSVFPEDIAEATFFLASDVSAKSTGNIINVDGGNVQAFTR